MAVHNRFPGKKGGLYIHVPFCPRKCHYCDFYSITNFSMIPDYLECLRREIRGVEDPAFPMDTLSFGGGTPSVLDAGDIGSMIESAANQFQFDPDTEISIEINPGTVNLRKLKAYESAGVNRITAGVQSFQDRFLKLLGRIHTASESISAIRRMIRAGFENFGIDLIYGIPGQSINDLIDDLETAAAFEPAHLSCYMLTIEPGTPMDRMRRNGRIKPLDETDGADFFRTAGEYLKSRGYSHYEISNFAASESRMSRHNFKYWSLAPYIGLGPSAHSYIEPVRKWNHRSLKAYINCLHQGKAPVEGQETLDFEKRFMEVVYLKLRTAGGIRLNEFKHMFGISFTGHFQDLIQELVENGLGTVSKDRFALTLKGMRVHEAAVDRFLTYGLPDSSFN